MFEESREDVLSLPVYEGRSCSVSSAPRRQGYTKFYNPIDTRIRIKFCARRYRGITSGVFVKSTLLFICLFVSLGGMASEPCKQPCQEKLVRAYYERLSAVARAGSGEKELNYLFELFHDDVKYEHIEYQANFDKTAWIAAFKRNFKRGAYKAPANRASRPLRMIHGAAHVAVEYAHGDQQADGSWKMEDEGLLAIFGFKDGKIVLVRELW